MRALRPHRLFVVDDRLWVLDATQPVAAVLSEGESEPRIVSAPDLPPGPRPDRDAGPQREAVAGGGALWVQEATGEPVGRVTLDGLEHVAWADGLRLLAAGPERVWLAEPCVDQLIVGVERLRAEGAGEAELAGLAPMSRPTGPFDGALPGRLVRIDAAGAATSFDTDGPVREARPDTDGLYVALERPEVMLRDLGMGEEYDIEALLAWVRIPWGAPATDPGQPISPGVHGVPTEQVPADVPPGGVLSSHWLDVAPWAPPLVHAGLAWRIGRETPASPYVPDTDDGSTFGWFAYAPMSGEHFPGGAAGAPDDLPIGGVLGGGEDDDTVAGVEDEVPPLPVVATVHRGDDLVHRWDLGPGDAVAMTPFGDGVAVIVAPEDGPARVLALDTDGGQRVLLDRELDITAHRRPIGPRPPETDSYLAQIVARHPVPDHEGVANARARVAGAWPEALLEWTFTHPCRPGLRLRTTFELFDEIGRVAPPGSFIDIGLMEDLDTGDIPPAERARDGILDM